MASKTPKKATKKDDGEAGVRAKMAAMPAPYRAIGERLHALILRSAPGSSRECGTAGWDTQNDGPVLCFFRVDEGSMDRKEAVRGWLISE